MNAARGTFVPTFVLIVGIIIGVGLGMLIATELEFELAVGAQGELGEENETTPTPVARYTGYEQRPRMLCGTVQRLPRSIDAIVNESAYPEPDQVTNVSELVEVDSYKRPNESATGWLLRLNQTAGDGQPIRWGTYDVNGETARAWSFDGAIRLSRVHGPQQHVFWDVRYPNATIRRYVARVCLPR